MPKKRLPLQTLPRAVSKILLVLMVLLTNLISTTSGFARQPFQGFVPWIPDGKWVGAFSGSDMIQIEDSTASASFQGNLSFEVVGREVLGNYTATGENKAENSQSLAYATFVSDGLIQGTSEHPELMPASYTFDFTILLKEFDTTTEQTVTLKEGFTPLSMTLLSAANCNMILGNFNAGATQNFQNAGVQVKSLQTHFTATRVGGIYESDPGVYQEKISALMQAGDKLIADTKATQALNADALWDILQQARDIDTGIRIDKECSQNKEANLFLSSIAGVIVKLIDLAFDHPEWFTAAQINQIAYAAYSVGLIGSGAANPALRLELEGKLENIITNKLKELDPNDSVCGLILPLYVVAQLMKSEFVWGMTVNLMEEYQCSES